VTANRCVYLYGLYLSQARQVCTRRLQLTHYTLYFTLELMYMILLVFGMIFDIMQSQQHSFVDEGAVAESVYYDRATYSKSELNMYTVSRTPPPKHVKITL